MAKKKGGSYYDFDILAFLDEYNVYYRESGKNIGRNWIGIDCPFCGGDGEHGGISMTTKKFSCFQCAHKATALGLVAILLKLDWSQAGRILVQFKENRNSRTIEEEIKMATKVQWPKHTKNLDKRGIAFLRKKNYDPQEIMDKYGVKQTYQSSVLKVGEQELDFKHRIIIPVVMNHQLVSFTGRDLTDKQDPRYKHSPLENSVVATASCLYNIDTVSDRAIFFEGPTDVWRFGSETVGMFGKTFTSEQIARISYMGLKKAVVMFDEGGDTEAEKLAIALSDVVDKVDVLPMLEGDPGEVDDVEAMKIKSEVLR